MQRAFAKDMASANNLGAIHKNIKEYSTLKKILERNSDFIKLNDDTPRVKTIDCSIMSTMINDALRNKTVLKVEESDYIFIRRSIGQKQQIDPSKRRDNLESDA